MNDTVRICDVDDLDEATPRRIDIGEHHLCVVRIGDRVQAIGDTCSHADVSLSEGMVDLDECAIECWKHGSLFSLATGEPLTLPATRPVPVYPVRVESGHVLVDLGERDGGPPHV